MTRVDGRTAARMLATGARDASHGAAGVAFALAVSALAGLLVAALLVPVVGAAGLAAKAQADDFLALPDDIEPPTPAQRSKIVAADGSLITYLYTENRVRVPLQDIPVHVQQALLAVEDARFYEHNGVDVKGSLRAAIENATSQRVEQGGSTLTQQYVKMARVAFARTDEERRAATEQSVERKLEEARLAIALERRLPKDEILQRYLNLAYFGNGAYGIATASQVYFSKQVADLTVAEGALLVGLVQSPSYLDPLKNLPAALARRDEVLRRMNAVGHLRTDEMVAALDEAPDLRPSATASGCEAPGVQAPFFCDYVRRVLEDTPLGAPFGKTREARQQALLSGGYTIVTTLEPGVQAAAQRAVDEAVPRDDPSGVAAAFTAVQPGSGRVQAVAVNRAFGEEGVGTTKLNLALGGSSGMQAGSTFKPFVLAAALEQGIPLNHTLQAPAEYRSKVFANCDGRTCDNDYVVRNAGDSSAGRHDLVSATHQSVNTYYIQLEEQTGVERPAQIAESLGLRQFANGSPSAPLHRGGSFVLGVNEVSPVQMSAAYAAFAAGGLYCAPTPVVRVIDVQGAEVPLPHEPCRQAIEPGIAETISSILRGNIDGPWSRTGARASIGRPAAGKTGSTNGSKAAWFAGYTPQLAASVWVGTPQPTPLRGVRIAGQYYRQVYGGTLPAPIWGRAMREIHEGVPVIDLPPAVASAPTAPARPERDTRDDDDRRSASDARRDARRDGNGNGRGEGRRKKD